MRFFILFLILMVNFSRLSIAGDIVFCHSFKGPVEDILRQLLTSFTHENPSIHVRLKYIGDYSAAFINYTSDEPQDSHMLLLSEVKFATALRMKDKFRAVDSLISLSPKQLPDYVRRFYTTDNGRILCFPFNISAPVMFINAKAWKAAGLNPSQLPTTWKELEASLLQLKKAGFGGMTTAWPAAYLIEHYAAINNVSLLAPNHPEKFSFAHPAWGSHLSRLVSWAQQGLYRYGGRYSDAENLFTSGEVAILKQGARRFPELSVASDFPILVAPLPYDSSLVKAPYGVNIGGASLWVREGLSEENYKDISAFLTFLMRTENQKFWFQKTHYLPITQEAVTEVEKDPENHRLAGYVSLKGVQNPACPASAGVRIPDYERKRALLIDSLENALSGRESPEQALKKAETLMNEEAP